MSDRKRQTAIFLSTEVTSRVRDIQIRSPAVGIGVVATSRDSYAKLYNVAVIVLL